MLLLEETLIRRDISIIHVIVDAAQFGDCYVTRIRVLMHVVRLLLTCATRNCLVGLLTLEQLLKQFGCSLFLFLYEIFQLVCCNFPIVELMH